MDNVTLINDARQLCANLEIALHTQAQTDAVQIKRLNNLLQQANLRYQRRINRCAVCYQLRFFERSADPHLVPCAQASFKWFAGMENDAVHTEETAS